MKPNWRSIFMIAAMVALFVAPLALNPGAKFSGSDNQGTELIEQTGYKPWMQPWWQPPSNEIESLLFSVQSGLGCLIIGYYIGVLKTGPRVTKANSESEATES